MAVLTSLSFFIVVGIGFQLGTKIVDGILSGIVHVIDDYLHKRRQK